MRMEKASVPSSLKPKVAQRLRNHETDIDGLSRKLTSLSSDRGALFGSRYKDDPSGGDEQLEQRQQLLTDTDRLGRSSNRLRESQRIANETEQIGAGTLGDLARQRDTIEHTRSTLMESEGYTDRSIKTLRGMARRCVIFSLSSDACPRHGANMLIIQDGYESDNYYRHHNCSGDIDHCCHRQQVSVIHPRDRCKCKTILYEYWV